MSVRVVISNFGRPHDIGGNYDAFWRDTPRPEPVKRLPLFEHRADWGFHLFALGLRLMDLGIADEVEFWDYAEFGTWKSRERGLSYHYTGILRVNFLDEEDVSAYIRHRGPPDLFVNHGRNGLPILRRLEGQCFRVHVPALRTGLDDHSNHDAECYLVDADEFLDDRSMLYIPVVNTRDIVPDAERKSRDFIYLAWPHAEKRHDIAINAAIEQRMTGHFHPVASDALSLRGASITTSDYNERDVVELLQTSRIAVYPGDVTSNPAAMWECVAAGLPIVVNAAIKGGKHLVVPGVTGELASEAEFGSVMQHVLQNRDAYRPREYFLEHWDSETLLDRYIEFFRQQGWPC